MGECGALVRQPAIGLLASEFVVIAVVRPCQMTVKSEFCSGQILSPTFKLRPPQSARIKHTVPKLPNVLSALSGGVWGTISPQVAVNADKSSSKRSPKRVCYRQLLRENDPSSNPTSQNTAALGHVTATVTCYVFCPKACSYEGISSIADTPFRLPFNHF